MSEIKPTNPAANLPSYFNKLSIVYPRSTGNVTKDLFSQLLPKIIPTVDSSSIIHDNASGPGTATTALLAIPEIQQKSPQIICTDMVPAMLDAVQELSTEHNWRNVSTKVMKSDEKFEFEDGKFTHSITNFSIFNFVDRGMAMREVYRTLRPGGGVVVATWKEHGWGAGEVIHKVQKRMRPDLPLMQFSGPDMYDGSAVRQIMVKSGFEEEKLEIIEGTQVTEGGNLESLVAFLKGKFCAAAMVDWADEEKARWNGEVDEIVRKDVEMYGGLRFEMWAVVGKR